jgi:hypothetical protein
LTLAVSGSLLGRRDAHPHCWSHLAAEFSHGWKQDDDLALPTFDGITECAADRSIVDAIEHKSALIVGKPNDQFLLLIGAGSDPFLGDVFDPQFLFLCES